MSTQQNDQQADMHFDPDLDGGAIDNDAYGQQADTRKPLETSKPNANDDAEIPGGDANQPGEELHEEEEFYYDGKPLVSPTSEEDTTDADSDLVKKLRGTIKQQRDQLRDRNLSLPQPQGAAPQNAQMQLPPMPKLEDEGIDYDSDLYAQKVGEWYQQKAQVEAQNRSAEEAQKALQATFDQRKAAYKERIGKSKIRGYEDAEAFVSGELHQNVQAALILHAERPEHVVLALARNPELMAKAKSITDPIQLGMLIGEVQAKTKAMPKAPNSAGGAPSDPKGGSAGAGLRTLEALHEEAVKTGDFTRYLSAKRSRAASAKK